MRKGKIRSVIVYGNYSNSGLDNSINNDIMTLKSIKAVLERIKRNPKDVRFNDLCKICDYYFGAPRQKDGSHRIYKIPWSCDPRINIQNHKGKAKVYQVKQVLKAIERLEAENANKG